MKRILTLLLSLCLLAGLASPAFAAETVDASFSVTLNVRSLPFTGMVFGTRLIFIVFFALSPLFQLT